jgi:hypothetical protein
MKVTAVAAGKQQYLKVMTAGCGRAIFALTVNRFHVSVTYSIYLTAIFQAGKIKKYTNLLFQIIISSNIAALTHQANFF